MMRFNFSLENIACATHPHHPCPQIPEYDGPHTLCPIHYWTTTPPQLTLLLMWFDQKIHGFGWLDGMGVVCAATTGPRVFFRYLHNSTPTVHGYKHRSIPVTLQDTPWTCMALGHAWKIGFHNWVEVHIQPL